jgi:hypothetical protein
MMACCLAAQMVAATGVQAEERNELPTAMAAGAFSALATVVAVPLKFATCVAVASVGGAGYGLTLGHSDFVREELLAGLPDACGVQLYTTAPEVAPYLDGPQPDEAW